MLLPFGSPLQGLCECIHRPEPMPRRGHAPPPLPCWCCEDRWRVSPVDPVLSVMCRFDGFYALALPSGEEVGTSEKRLAPSRGLVIPTFPFEESCPRTSNPVTSVVSLKHCLPNFIAPPPLVMCRELLASRLARGVELCAHELQLVPKTATSFRIW